MKKRVFLVLALILSLALLVTSPVLAKQIKVLGQFPLSGRAGDLPEFGWGWIDAMNWINGPGGGVNGKKIKWYLEDFRYERTC